MCNIFDSKLNERVSNSNNDFRNWGTQAIYKHNFPKTGHELTADINYFKGKNKNENRINTSIFDLPGKDFLRNSGTLQYGSGNNDNLIAQTDYANPLSENSKLELGARASIRNIDSRTDYYFVDANGNAFYNTDQSINFKSRDRVYAAYANFANRIKTFGYQLGLRVESSDYEGTRVSKNLPFKKEFPVSLFPCLFLTQKACEID